MDYGKLIVIVPSYEPKRTFVDYAMQVAAFAGTLVVVNDGSGREYDGIFEEIAKADNVRYIAYGENHGRGYALKKAFRYCSETYDEDYICVTADGDGRYGATDIRRVAKLSAEHEDALVLGSRNFGQPYVSKKSKAQNDHVRRRLRLLHGLKLSDAQTALRGFSVGLAKRFLAVRGDRSEYETNMLVYAQKNGIPITELPIRTGWDLLAEKSAGQRKRFYGRFIAFVRGGVRVFMKKYKSEVCPPEEPTVYVCRHLNMHGPITSIVRLDFHVHPMVLSCFLDKEQCYRQYAEFTFTERIGKNKKKHNWKAYAASRVVPSVMRSLGAIPVYRGAGANSLHTMRDAIACLKNHESVIVYPDVDYTAGYETESELYEGFLLLGQLYKRNTGKSLRFVPLYIDEKERKIREYPPVTVDDFKAEHERAYAYIKEAINGKGATLENVGADVDSSHAVK